MLEFALVMPFLLIIIFGIIDFGMGLRSYITLANGVREGARFAAVGNPAGDPSDCDGSTNTSVYGRVCVAVEGLDLAKLRPSVFYPSGESPGNPVVVSGEYTYDFITPLGDLVNFFTAGAFPDALTLESTTDMRLE